MSFLVNIYLMCDEYNAWERSKNIPHDILMNTLLEKILTDELAREARMTIVRSLHASAAGFYLATDLADTIEQASDDLLAAGYALRKMVLTKTGMAT